MGLLKQDGPPEAGLGLRGDEIMLESDAESRPQELSTPSRTIFGRLKRIDSSDVSLSPEPYGLEGFAHSHINGLRHHFWKDVSIDSRHAHHAIQRTDFRERSQSYPIDHIGKGGNPELGEDRGAIPDYEIIVSNEDLVHPSKNLYLTPHLSWQLPASVLKGLHDDYSSNPIIS